MTFEFTTKRRIHFAETDLAGIVHFSNYFRYMEVAEHEFLRSLGISVHAEIDGRLVGWPRVRAECSYRAPLERYRVSVLWKADVYRNEAEQRRRMADTLSIPDVVRIFDRDLEDKGVDVRFDLDRIEDPGLIAAVNAVYPEAVPVGKAQSVFDAA